MIGFVLLVVGIVSFGLAISQFRDFKLRRGDFSDWIVSDAAEFNRSLWFSNTRLTLAILALFGPLLIVGGMWMLLKN